MVGWEPVFYRDMAIILWPDKWTLWSGCNMSMRNVLPCSIQYLENQASYIPQSLTKPWTAAYYNKQLYCQRDSCFKSLLGLQFTYKCQTCLKSCKIEAGFLRYIHAHSFSFQYYIDGHLPWNDSLYVGSAQLKYLKKHSTIEQTWTKMSFI